MPASPLTLDFIYRNSPVKTLNRTAKSRVFGIKTRKNFRRFVFYVKSREVYSSPEGHISSIIYPSLNLDSVRNSPGKKTPSNQPVNVWCTCPAFLYWGSAFLSTELGYNFIGEENRFPKIRDPENHNYVCKHLLRVTKNLRRMSFTALTKLFNVDKTASSKLIVSQNIEDILSPDYEDDFFFDGEFISIEETFSTIERLLSSRGFSLDDRVKFISSLDENNYVPRLVQAGIII